MAASPAALRRLWLDLAAAPSRPFSRREGILLAVITAAGALLRVLYQRQRSFLGDELGTLRWIEESYGFLLRHFDTWLTMNYFLVIEKAMVEAFGSERWVLVALPWLFGVATIPLTALLARRFLTSEASLAAGLLIAFNPYLIHQSVTIRSYALLAAFAILALILFCRWLRHRRWRDGCWFAACALLLVLAHPNGAYPLAALALLYLLSDDIWRRGWRSAVTLVVPSVLAVLGGFLAYRALLGPMARAGERFHDQAPTGLGYLSPVWSDFFAAGFWGWPTLALLGLAGWRAIAHRSSLQLALGLVLIPPILLALQGISHYPWGVARFLVFVLPLLIILLAAGLKGTVGVGQRRGLVLPLAVALALTWAPNLIERWQDQAQYPWDTLRQHLLSESRETPTLVLATDLVTTHSLDPRPAAATYDWLLLSKLERTTAALPEQLFLVLRDVAPTCGREIRAFRRLTVIRLQASDREAAYREIERCLFDLVVGRWPVEARYEAIYAHLLDLAQRRGDADAVARYHDLQTATAALDDRRRWTTQRMHQLDAERTSRIWQRRWKNRPRDTSRAPLAREGVETQ